MRPEAETGVGDTSGGFVIRCGGGDNVVTMSEQSIPPKPSMQTHVFTFEQTYNKVGKIRLRQNIFMTRVTKDHMSHNFFFKLDSPIVGPSLFSTI